MRIGGKSRVIAMAGATAIGIEKEQTQQASRDLVGRFAKIHHPARADRYFNSEAVTIKVVIPIERLDDKVVHREPHRATPVGVASEIAESDSPGLNNPRERPPTAAPGGTVPIASNSSFGGDPLAAAAILPESGRSSEFRLNACETWHGAAFCRVGGNVEPKAQDQANLIPRSPSTTASNRRASP